MRLWIGLVELKPLNRKGDDPAGAFTNIITWASNSEGFRQKAETIAATIDRYVADIEGAEPFEDRAKRETLDEEIEDMALRAESNPNAIIWGTFFTYPFNEG